MNLRRASLILAVLWTFAIMVVCWMPMSQFPQDAHGSSIFDIPYLDKVIHFGIFVVFGVLWNFTFPGRRPALTILLAGAAFAFLTEAVQMMPMIGRQADLDDAACDIFGVLVGVLLVGRFVSVASPPLPSAITETAI